MVFDDADDMVDSAGRPRPKGSGVLLRNVVKVEDLEDPIALGMMICYLFSIGPRGSLRTSFCSSGGNSRKNESRDAHEDLQPPTDWDNA